MTTEHQGEQGDERRDEYQRELAAILSARRSDLAAEELLYPVIVEIPVRWGDMDAFQHVNNTIYFRYFEIARIAYFERLAVPEFMLGTDIGPILADASCRFRYPLTYPDTVLTATRVTAIHSDRFVMEHVVTSRAARRVAARGDGAIVTFDYRAGAKVDVPPSVAQAVRNLEASAGRTIAG